jgi:hypothetical protein
MEIAQCQGQEYPYFAMSTPPISQSFCAIPTADFFVDLDVRCAPSLKASGGADLALLRLRLRASDGPAAGQAFSLRPFPTSSRATR